jgi:rubrerythrin
MLDFCDLKTGEMVTMGRQAVSSCARRLDEIARASDPADQPLLDLLRKMALEQDIHAAELEQLENLYDEDSPLPSRSESARQLILGILTSLSKRMGEGPLLRDAALFYAESLEEEASRFFRTLAGHARESRVVERFFELATWEHDNVSFLRDVVLQG